MFSESSTISRITNKRDENNFLELLKWINFLCKLQRKWEKRLMKTCCTFHMNFRMKSTKANESDFKRSVKNECTECLAENKHRNLITSLTLRKCERTKVWWGAWGSFQKSGHMCFNSLTPRRQKIKITVNQFEIGHKIGVHFYFFLSLFGSSKAVCRKLVLPRDTFDT